MGKLMGPSVDNTQSLELFPRNLHEDFFLKIGILSPQGVYKKRPQHRSMKLHPCPAQKSVFQASLIGCVKLCSRLYVNDIDEAVVSAQIVRNLTPSCVTTRSKKSAIDDTFMKMMKFNYH